MATSDINHKRSRTVEPALCSHTVFISKPEDAAFLPDRWQARCSDFWGTVRNPGPLGRLGRMWRTGLHYKDMNHLYQRYFQNYTQCFVKATSPRNWSLNFFFQNFQNTMCRAVHSYTHSSALLRTCSVWCWLLKASPYATDFKALFRKYSCSWIFLHVKWWLVSPSLATFNYKNVFVAMVLSEMRFNFYFYLHWTPLTHFH